MAINMLPSQSSCRCVALCGSDVVFRCDGEDISFSDLQCLHLRAVAQEFSPMFFEEKSTNICALWMDNAMSPGTEYQRQTLRSFFAQWGETIAMPYFRAKALAEWMSRTRFCPKCGSRLHLGEESTSMVCPDCGNVIFPRIEPCIIVLVSRGDEILLGLHRQRNIRCYSCLAGFMEAGESAEQAVQREIMEETGIRVRNIRYYGSQSWPFPSQLMLGFTAEYESGEIHVQQEELQNAAWFPRSECPATPPPGSLAYRLIHGE